MKLFALHGVSGTSLQMIATELGITKASIYHHFGSKEEIVRAVIEPTFEQIGSFVAEAEGLPTPGERRRAAIAGLVSVSIDNREVTAVIGTDPSAIALANADANFLRISQRLNALLLGPEPTPATRAAIVYLSGGLRISGASPHLSGLDPELVRHELIEAGWALFERADRPASHHRKAT